MWSTPVFWAVAIFVMPFEQPTSASPEPADSKLTQRLAQAEIVVSGIVLDTVPAKFQRPASLSEHDPHWQQATIKVETVEKGHVTEKIVPVLFAGSTDITSLGSPKLKKGDHGVWLLQNRDRFGRPVPGYAVVDAADQQPVAQLEKIRALLKNAYK
jgi:hypothetical protein